MNSPERNPLSPRSLMDAYKNARLIWHVGEAAAALTTYQQPLNLDQPPTEAEILWSAATLDEADRRRTGPITMAEIAVLRIGLENQDEQERRRLVALNMPSNATVAHFTELLAHYDSEPADETPRVSHFLDDNIN